MLLPGIMLLLLATVSAVLFGRVHAKATGGGSMMGTAFLWLIFSFIGVGMVRTAGWGTILTEPSVGKEHEEGRVYQLYGSVQQTGKPGYDVVIGEPGQEAYCWHVSDVPSPSYVGFVQVAKLTKESSGGWCLVKAEELTVEKGGFKTPIK